jgi:DinB superfamily
MPQKRPLSELVTELGELAQQTDRTFSSLSTGQLNWKPSPEQWSIAQCFDHLFISAAPYLTIFKQVAKGEKKNTFWESVPLLPDFFGGLLVKSLDPASTRKLKSPAVFQPSSSDIDGQIIPRFVDQQKELSRAMSALEGKDLDRIIITSPALKLITYSLRSACTVVVVHGQRHFQQAARVLASKEFPGA